MNVFVVHPLSSCLCYCSCYELARPFFLLSGAVVNCLSYVCVLSVTVNVCVKGGSSS
jgi:hypothetical protein